MRVLGVGSKAGVVRMFVAFSDFTAEGEVGLPRVLQGHIRKWISRLAPVLLARNIGVVANQRKLRAAAISCVRIRHASVHADNENDTSRYDHSVSS